MAEHTLYARQSLHNFDLYRKLVRKILKKTMRAVQQRFGKTDGVHAYQSFREGEVTPEQCHEIGAALACKVWGKRFQVLVATHMNTDNLHNHFVINSVSYVDGKKYEQRRSQYAEFRAASDKLCREYGLSVVEQPKKREPARYARMREAIDQACEDASTAEDFHRALYRQGYIFGSDPQPKVRNHPGAGWRPSGAALACGTRTPAC